MKFTIITPSFNQAGFIGRTIDSVLKQKGSFEIEYFVMDGGSKDDTVKILKKFEGKVKRGEYKKFNKNLTFGWISEKDKGQSDAINKGLRKATGEIIAYINSDDIYYPDAFAAVMEGFRNNPQKIWLSGKCRIINEDDQEIRKKITAYKNFFLKRYSYNKLLILNFVSQPATFWRQSAQKKVGVFNENEHLVMDYDYWMKIGKLSDMIYINSYLSGFRSYVDNKSSRGFVRQFADEYRVATGNTGNWLLLVLHKIHAKLICLAYKVIS